MDLSPDPAEHDGAELAAAVARLAQTSVLVIGDVMLDRAIYGHVARISPEAPVPVLAIEREVALPGGAGNVVRNLTALGAGVAFISVLGDDQAGSDLTGLVGGQPGVEPWLLVQGGRTTTVKTRFLAAGQHLLRADREEVAPVHPKLAERMIRIARDAMAATSVTVLSDYRKGLFGGEVAPALIAAAREAGRTVIVAAKADPGHAAAGLARYRGADVLILGHETLLAEGDDTSPADPQEAAAALRDRHGFGAVLLTRHGDGMTLIAEGRARHFPAEAREVYDTAGAGDTVAAVLAAGLAARLDLALAVRLASIAAGIVVGKVGTAICRPADLLEALSPQGSGLRKIVGRQAAEEQAARWRHKGLRVGFTNGCFDLLHPGHVSLLEQARNACDRLVVGLNDDASVRRLKGADRPVQSAAARAAVLSGLGSVDLVSVFEEDTPEALIEALRPDLLVKGADYAPDQVVGAEAVRGWGGRVMLATLLEGYSTTATVAKIRG
ncbi:MAG: D-glycero-beta-D-manno-heptose 1-phosphate adenylyltransferase [Rhodospirillales bacterium]|nr:D-glycero-beta-D-manno-heptose 1-phosphate adenylyltransferase [Rhodospirillales bacterium]